MSRLFALAGFVLALGWFASPVSAQEKWGAIKGRIVWGGAKVPEREDLTPLIQKNPDRLFCLKDGKVFDEKWVIDPKTKGIQWTFVWLVDEKKNPLPIHPKLKKLAKDTVEIDQPICMYLPHGIALREGQTLVARNTAKVAHNVLHIGPDGAGNPLLPPGKQYELKLKASPAPTTLSCSIHPWMKAYVRVFDHPYFAITDEKGNFTIKDAPAGDYRLIVWHGTGGWRGGAAGRTGQRITIEADQVKDLGDLRYPPPKN